MRFRIVPGALLAAMLLDGAAAATTPPPASTASPVTTPIAAATPTAKTTPAPVPTAGPATAAEKATAARAAQAAKAAIAELMDAASESGSERLTRLIDSGVPVNSRMPNGETALQSAAAEGRITNVFMLLTRGAEIDTIAARGTTALGWAARNGHLPTVRTLLDAGAGPDVAADAGHTPITLAIGGGHQSIVSLLIERGSKVFEKPEMAAPALIALGEASSVPLTNSLVPRMAGLVASSADMRRAAVEAIVSSDTEIAQSIERHLAPTSQTREFQTTLLFAAARRKRPSLVAAAVARGADVNARDPQLGTPLATAVIMGDADSVAVLLAADVDWTTAGVDEDKLRVIAGDRIVDLRVAQLLERIGAPDVRDDRGETPLFRAAERGDIGVVGRLLRSRVNPAATVRRWPGDAGWTALMAAAAGGHSTIVEQLLAAGAPVDQRNAAGRTALDFAAWYGRSSVVALLLAAGADPLVRDHADLTPLALALAGGDPTTAELLRSRLPSAQVAAPGAASSP